MGRLACTSVGLWLALAASGHAPRSANAAEAPRRWTAATPDATIDLAAQAVRRNGPDALARLLLIHQLQEQASATKARAALAQLGNESLDVAYDAHWLAAALQPDAPLHWPGLNALPVSKGLRAAPVGLVRAFAVLGPFEDTGGGLQRHEGPELPNHKYASADYSWGAYKVVPQRSLIDGVSARGVPLDAYIYPRRESCTYLSSAVRLPTAEPYTIHIAASGSLRVMWDGQEVAADTTVHQQALVERMAVRVSGAAGQHLLTLKNCSGARPDSGRIRVTVSDKNDAHIDVEASSAASELQALASRLAAAAKPPQGRASQLPTALDKLRKPSADAPIDTVLAAAAVRLLGGSDNLQIGSGPGLLDRALGATPHATPTADQQAFGGFISPSGANRSARLNEALSAAQRASDNATAAFAQRVLIAGRSRNRQAELAQSMLKQPPLRDATDAHARWLRAEVKVSVGSEGMRYAALHDLQGLAKELGASTPAAVWMSLLRLSSLGEPKLLVTAQQRLTDLLPDAADSHYVNSFAMLGDPWLVKIARSRMLQQTNTAQWLGMGQRLAAAGHYKPARDAFQLAAKLSPNHPEIHIALAKVEAMVARDPAAPAAVEALERAKQLRPQDVKLAARLAFLQGEASSAPSAGEDAPYLVAAKVFLDRAKANPAPAKGVFARELHWRRVVRFHPDKRVSQLMHYAREILVPPRTQAEREERLPSRGGELLIARVHRKDGTTVQPERREDAGGYVLWPKLERGDVVEIAVRSWTPGPVGRRGDAPFYFVDYVGSVASEPVLYNDVILDAPRDSPLAYDVVGGKPDEKREEVVDGRRVTRLIWNKPPTIADEPWSPRPSELMPVVVGSAYPSWDSFLQWYSGAVEGFTQPDAQITRLAQELTEGKKTREAKVQALFNFVADDIRYVNFVSGEWWLPNRPQQLLARRQGDCDDKAMLLISLLRAVNIEAKEVLIQTRQTAQRAVMRSSKVAIPMFDHGIIYLPNENGEGGRYLDATSPQSRIGALPSMDSGAMALILEDEQAQVRETAAAKAADHGVDAHWTLTLDKEGAGTIVAKERHVGDNAFRLRTNLREEDTRAQWVEQRLIGGWFPSLEVNPAIPFDGELKGGAATLEYQAASRAIARREGKDLLVVVAPPVAISATLAPLTKRTLPVELPGWMAPSHRRMTIDIVAPASHQFAGLPPDAEADAGAFGSAKVAFRLSADKRTLTIERHTNFDKARIPVADYARWRAWLQAIDRMMQRAVRLTPR